MAVLGDLVEKEFTFLLCVWACSCVVHLMAEDDKGYGPWSRVPVWDGSFNLAARFLLRQPGVARQRGEEITPD